MKSIVCIIEPYSSGRDRLKEILISMCDQVKTFDSAESFLAQCASMQQGCVITAATSPGMSALELLHRLKGDRKTVRVIVLGEDSKMPLAVSLMRAGATDFIEKPFTNHNLRKAVRRAIT